MSGPRPAARTGLVGTVTVVSSADAEVIADLVPGGVLRAAINLGNPVLAQGLAAEPRI
jgi:hypothetical protein